MFLRHGRVFSVIDRGKVELEVNYLFYPELHHFIRLYWLKKVAASISFFHCNTNLFSTFFRTCGWLNKFLSHVLLNVLTWIWIDASWSCNRCSVLEWTSDMSAALSFMEIHMKENMNKGYILSDQSVAFMHFKCVDWWWCGLNEATNFELWNDYRTGKTYGLNLSITIGLGKI